MNERKVCAESFYEERNCPYAKIVEETGEFPVITFTAKEINGVPDLARARNVKTRIDTSRFCVYCTHPSYSKEKLIGGLEPYFSCYAPSDCPELQKCKATDKISLLKMIKNFFSKK